MTGTPVSGNPVSYYGAGSRRWTMAWKNGKELASATASGRTVSYEYDKNGLRTSKTYNGTKYSYAYAGDKLIWQGWGNEELYFFYNASGEPLEFWHYTNGTKTKAGFYYTNLQGDVVRIEDVSGNVLASYSYDPWGKLRSYSGTYATKNPLRYRGYYYDTETGFYYLQSRYYDPTVSRFINADSYASTGQGFLGYNMFVYCGNNPVSCSDPSGHMMAPYFAWESAGGGPLVSQSFMAQMGGGAAGISSTVLPMPSSGADLVGSSLGLAAAIAASAWSSSKAEEAVGELSRKKQHPIFPENPDEFAPRGLNKEVRVKNGKGKNGGIIQWTNPISKQPIFEWNEDIKNGPHYHARLLGGELHDGNHYYSGDPVPAELAVIYFGE